MAGIAEVYRKVEANKDLCFDLLRIYLGVGLFVKGIHFLTDMSTDSRPVDEDHSSIEPQRSSADHSKG
jgi:uncharacterized membrane protein YphA (DoxX/SURF4 family)